MHFNVSQLLKENIGSTRSYNIDEVLSLTDDAETCHVTGIVDMLRTDKGVWISAVLDSVVSCACSRCLNEFEQPIHMSIDEEYLPLADINSGARLYYSSDDENFFIDHSHILDMTEAVRQYSALSLPMKPICRENCRGICLTCGVDLNETSCFCDKTRGDARWNALLELVPASDSDDR